MNQRYPRAAPMQFQRGDGGRILRADYRNVLVVIRVRLFVIMQNLLQVLTGYVEHIGNIVVTGGENDFSRVVETRAAEAVRGVYLKCVIFAGDAVDALVLPNIE